MLHKEFIEMSDELIRMKEMDYYKYHSFLNKLEVLYNGYESLKDEKAKAHVQEFAKEAIRVFIDTYGGKNYPEPVRKSSQQLIVEMTWNFN